MSVCLSRSTMTAIDQGLAKVWYSLNVKSDDNHDKETKF